MSDDDATVQQAGEELPEDHGEECAAGKRYRHWVFTKHNYGEEDIDAVYSLGPYHGAAYVSCGREICPTTGTPHLQGVVSFPTVKAWSQMREILPEAYWKAKYKASTFKQWAQYTQKEDKAHYEYGKIPADPVVKGERSAEWYNDQAQCVREKRLDDMDPVARYTMLRQFDYAIKREKEMFAERDVQDLEVLHNEWHWGRSGCGKTRVTEARYGGRATVYDKCWRDEWWDTYAGQPVLLLDEVDPSWLRKDGLYWLKNISAHKTFEVRRRNIGAVRIRPKAVIVTSQTNPESWFSAEDFDAIKRRFKIIEWKEPMFLDPGPDTMRNPAWVDMSPDWGTLGIGPGVWTPPWVAATLRETAPAPVGAADMEVDDPMAGELVEMEE